MSKAPAYSVASSDSDTDGVSIAAGRIDRNGGTIKDGADHDGLASNTEHKVDGVKPVLAATGGEVVNGTTLTLTYDEPLDGSSTPEAGDFTAWVENAEGNVSNVAVSGQAVTLTLDRAVEDSATCIRERRGPCPLSLAWLPQLSGSARSRDLAGPFDQPHQVHDMLLQSGPASGGQMIPGHRSPLAMSLLD